jgi:hypothetical protein
MRVLVAVMPMVLTLIAGGAGSCAARPVSAQTPQALVGMWGGERIRVDAAATSVRIQVDCLLARADEAIAVDKAGTFSLTVRFAPLRAVEPDEPEERPMSRVTGRIENDVLHLTIAPEGSEGAGTFTLRRNARANLPNCKLRS